MKILLLGAAGFIGRVAAQVLSSRADVEELFLVDYNIRDAKKFGKKLSPKCRWAMADAGRAPEMERLLAGIDAVANAVGPCAEYEKGILLACAGKGKHAASIGDGTFEEDARREIHDAFRRAGKAAVSGCGMMPGWTELLSAHFLAGGRTGREEQPGTEPRRYLFASLDRYGGYAFFRRLAKASRREKPAAPPASPAGCYFDTGDGLIGLPPGRPASLFRRFGKTLGGLGPVGLELSAALLFWLRGSLSAGEGSTVAVAGAWREEPGKTVKAAALEDTRGILAGVLLAEVALKLAAGAGGEKGLVPLPALIGREEAERIANERGGKIIAG
ncbi:MAG: saccharopine dehydrogenase NADP-binding domain-containing protein [Deltaproteobacteria bacterium]|nr:saccharopine dehydrogenase NADP-binding domain-containing protein [Deltaproteobacteria bacterium]